MSFSLMNGSTLVIPPLSYSGLPTVPSPPNPRAHAFDARTPSPREELPSSLYEAMDWRKQFDVKGSIETARVIVIISDTESTLMQRIGIARSIICEQVDSQFTLLLNYELKESLNYKNLISKQVVPDPGIREGLKALQEKIFSLHETTFESKLKQQYLELETTLTVGDTQKTLNEEINSKEFRSNRFRKIIIYIKSTLYNHLIPKIESGQKGFVANIVPRLIPTDPQTTSGPLQLAQPRLSPPQPLSRLSLNETHQAVAQAAMHSPSATGSGPTNSPSRIRHLFGIVASNPNQRPCTPPSNPNERPRTSHHGRLTVRTISLT